MTASFLRFRPALALFPLVTACPSSQDDPLPEITSHGNASTDGDSSSASESTGEDPMQSTSDDAAESSSDDGPVPSECPEPSSGPTMHPGNNIESDELWTADGSPHLVPYDFTINAQVVIEPCARVQLGASLTLTVADGGSIIAEGEAARPIVFERLADDRWTAIRLYGGTASFAYATLDGGGRTGNTWADLTGALLVRGREGATTPDGTLAVSHVEIRDAQSPGVRLDGFGAFTADSDALVITGGESHPISASATGIGTIPAGNYVGNADDQIVITTTNTETISSDATLHDRGVPYFVGVPDQVGDLRVQAQPGELATLTIEPGVELRFQPGGSLTVQYGGGELPATGALVAVGTEDAPIVMTSAQDEPMPGDWLGLSFGARLDPSDLVDHVRIEYAGGSSSSGSESCPYPDEPINDAALRIFGVPPGAFVTNTEILASASHGIDRGWRDDFVVDLLDTNDFDVAGCRETVSRTDDGTCPDPVPCS